MQWLADEGFAVLWTNPRGSHTFGEQYARCIDPHWGTPDGRDQLAFADWLAARTEVDGARLGVTGGSYGGFMTCFLAATSDRFRAAAADRGLYDWALDAAAGDFGHAIPETFGFDLPWRDHEPWQPYSLLRIAHQIRCPFLVLHGEGDLRCDKSQALALYEVLLRAGTPTALLLYPEEDHGMTRGGRLDRRADRLRQLSAWFKRFLA
jgi:dipeptidyl aminopeptidase/acylaminoacyl peptidase